MRHHISLATLAIGLLATLPLAATAQKTIALYLNTPDLATSIAGGFSAEVIKGCDQFTKATSGYVCKNFYLPSGNVVPSEIVANLKSGK
ncbi:hypothetical protein HDU67_006009 [Dinochytrium kinnereticum]|nr:hypothetical protein HDU67_006009 [Dinochytrium kinnereticum]